MNLRTLDVSSKNIKHANLHDKVYFDDGRVGLVVQVNRKRWWQFWKRHTIVVQDPIA